MSNPVGERIWDPYFSLNSARLEWKLDIDFMPADQLMRPRISAVDDVVKLERQTLLCILETRHELASVKTKAGHLEKFQSWLDIQADRAASGTYDLIEKARDLTLMTHDERLRSIDTSHAAVRDSRLANVRKVVQHVLENCSAIFSQQVDPIDILMQDDGLKKIYDIFRELWDFRKSFDLHGHAKPTLQVLEIGAGTGGTAAAALEGLATEAGERMYFEYCYTDISAGFFVAAQKRFKDFENIDYKVLDISKDPIDQGFQPESYDLILASNGILPGWWLGELDNRPYQPYISVERWHRELQATGFSGVDLAVYDGDLPYQINVNIVSSPATTPPRSKSLTLLCEDRSSAIARQVEAIFMRNGYRLDYCTIDDLPPSNQDVVSVMDLTAPFFDGILPNRLSAFQRYIGHLGSSGLLWIILASQVDCKDPRYSQILGAARTIRSELLLDFATVEIDKADEVTLEELIDVRSKEQEIDPDWEFAVVDGTINIPRYHWISVADELLATPSQEKELPRKLQVGKTGSLQSLQWVQGLPIALAPNEVDVKTVAVGLNFKIFASVGTEEKVQYLMKTFGITQYGKMLEIGKRDFIGRGMLSMDLFEANRAFFGIDLARLDVERPEACTILLDQCVEFYRQGLIGPIKPMKVFEATNIIEAFKHMQKEAFYLLVGGLSGLGKAIATWMVERGARHLIFLSRSAGKGDGDQEFLRELEAQGCLVWAVCGSVDHLGDAESTVMNAPAPIAGVMHMSIVLKDRNLLDFTHEEWHAAITPKMEGAWNLRRTLLDKDLDYFILFSSMSAIVGQWGQANYAAAKSFLDSFVQYRHSVGLPASAINIGVMEDVGYVSQNPGILEQLKATSAHTLREQDLIDALQLMMPKRPAIPPPAAGFQNPMQMVIGMRTTKTLSDPSNRGIWKRDIRMSLYRNLEEGSAPTTGAVNEDLKHFLAVVASQPSILDDQSILGFLTRQIGSRLYSSMLQSEDDMDVRQSLSALGVDSLVAIEIRNWWRQSLGLEISVLEIMNCGSIEQMGLQRKHEAPATRTSDDDTYLLMKAP
ncbi:MAG: hypothetical protein Q9218_001037 [Villophora microphyllina]